MNKNDERKKKRMVVKEIAKTSEAIRKKYLALKVGKKEAETNLQSTLKPIVEPLQQLVKNTGISSTADIKRKLLHDDDDDDEENEEEEGDSVNDSIATPILSKKKKLIKNNENKILHSTPTTMTTTTTTTATSDATPVKTLTQQVFESPANKSPTMESSMRNIFENPHTEDVENNYLLKNLGPLAREYLHNFFIGTSKSIDNVYGVHLRDDKLMLGNLAFDITNDDNILINGKKYAGTRGLYELIFKKIPDETSYTETDMKNYKTILMITHAHKRGNQVMGNKGYKYRRIIGPLFSPRLKKGSGILLPTSMCVTNNVIDYVHWDDPNELVERLKLLVASQSAGHTAHNNEILSIIEELREADIITN